RVRGVATLGYQGYLTMWRILQLEVLVGETSGLVKLEEMRRFVLGDDLERRIAASDTPFTTLYTILNEFCVSLIMDTVIIQIQALRIGRWKDAIQFELISDGYQGQGSSASSVQTSQDGEADFVIVPDFQPKQVAKIDTDENVTNLSSASIDYIAVIDELIKKLEIRKKILSSGYVMKPIQFEKNYRILDVDKLRAKFIVGRIILAIVASIAVATGLVCLELYKVIDGGRKVEDYLNTFANLALSLFCMAEPVPLKQHASLGYVFDPTKSTKVSSEVVSCSQGTVEPHGSIGALAGGRAIAQWNTAEFSEALFR
nr:ubiquitin-activating enzyme E1 1-like isoform X2 [Tanacetum cinerariifolium]